MRLRRIAVALVAAAALAPATPASAAGGDVLLLSLAGNILPGLTAVPAPQVFTLAGPAIFVGTDGVATTYPCNFSGNGLADSVEFGIGTMAGSCGPLAFSTCVYERHVTDWTVQCLDVNSGVETLTAKLVFQPTTLNPTITFSAYGAAIAVT